MRVTIDLNDNGTLSTISTTQDLTTNRTISTIASALALLMTDSDATPSAVTRAANCVKAALATRHRNR